MAWFLVQGVPFENAGGGQPQPPLGIWGPNDPRPTLPIAGWNPGTGGWPQPPGGGQPPLGIWGPNDPRPTPPIAGWNPGTGTWPQPQPPLGIWGPGDPRPTLPIAGWNPGTGGWPSYPIVIPPDVIPGSPPGAGMIAVIPAGTTIVSTADIQIPNPSDPENPFVIPAGTTIVTSQAILIPTGYMPPASAERPIPTPVKEK